MVIDGDAPSERQQHVVTAADLASFDANQLQWVQVAARALPVLGTVSKAKRERKAGKLLLNGQLQVPTLVRAVVGDVLAYCSPEQEADLTESSIEKGEQAHKWLKTCITQGLRVVHDSDALAVVVKPVGIHVKGRGKRTVERALPLLLPKRNAGEADFVLPVPHAVHRLDYRVGGLLLVARTRKMEVELAAQFERHSVIKRYRAILVGKVGKDMDRSGVTQQTLVLPKALESIRDEVQLIDDVIEGKQCLTVLRVASTTRSARYSWITTVDLWPLTGRKHQLRIHTARCGHPIVGDDLYHDEKTVEKELALDDTTTGHRDSQSSVVRGMGLFLFSVGLEFDDANGNRRSFHIDEPHKFERFRHFSQLNWAREQARQRSTRPEN